MRIKNAKDETKIRDAAELATKIVKKLSEMIQVGNTPAQLEKKAWELCEQNGATPSFADVPNENGPYGYSCCISVNDEILHGIPSAERKFEEGDIVKIDFGLIKDGYFTDQCFTFVIGDSDSEALRLAKVARLATESAMRKAVAGTRAGDLGAIMEGIARAAGFDTLKMFVGHGIGRSLHESPEVPAFGPAGSGDKLKEGMVICVECQVVEGEDSVYVEDDGWTIKSIDGGRGAMVEYMVIVGKKEPKILTPMLEWSITV